MGKTYERLDGRLRGFIEEQVVFFVATAPLAAQGSVNLSPKGRGWDAHRPRRADLRENGRITLMWCAFSGPPTIVRVHGRGEPVFRDDPRFAGLLACFDPRAADPTGLRSIIDVSAERISDSCGYAVPFMEYREERSLHREYFGRRTDEEFAAYCERKEYNGRSIDGLPALPLPLPPLPPGPDSAAGPAVTWSMENR